MAKQILLSFDVEEFDIPLEFQHPVPMDQQMAMGAQGLQTVLALLQPRGIRSTLFTTAHFADHQATLVKQAAATHEIASHSYHHSRYDDADLLKSRLALQSLTGQPITGFRRPRLQPTDSGLIREAGYTYNSSENPIWLPGRYNNLRRPRTAYRDQGLLNIPISASPGLRVPLFWLAIKNFPMRVIRYASQRCLDRDGYLCIFFHPWEFLDLSGFGLPGYIARRDGQAMVDRLEAYLDFLSPLGEFVTMDQFARERQFALES